MGRCLGRPEALDLPGVETKLQVIVSSPCSYWDWNSGSLEDQYMFLILSTIFLALKQILKEALEKIEVVLFVAYVGDRF